MQPTVKKPSCIGICRCRVAFWLNLLLFWKGSQVSGAASDINQPLLTSKVFYRVPEVNRPLT